MPESKYRDRPHRGAAVTPWRAAAVAGAALVAMVAAAWWRDRAGEQAIADRTRARLKPRGAAHRAIGQAGTGQAAPDPSASAAPSAADIHIPGA